MIITADQARNMVSARSSKQADRLDTRIRKEAAKGDTYFILWESLDQGMKDYLKELGYKVEWNSSDSYKISWK